MATDDPMELKEITFKLPKIAIENAHGVHEKWKTSHIDGEDWSDSSFDDFIDEAINRGLDEILDELKKHSSEQI